MLSKRLVLCCNKYGISVIDTGNSLCYFINYKKRLPPGSAPLYSAGLRRDGDGAFLL